MITPDEFIFQLIPCSNTQLEQQFKECSLNDLNDFVAQIDKECNAMITLNPGLDSTKALLAKFIPVRKLAEKHVKSKLNF